jgi:hypothetical protein
MDIDKLNKWTADKLAIYLYKPKEVNEHGYYFYNKVDMRDCDYEWTMQDARCREIVREHFKVDTTWTTDNDWYCFVELDKDDYLVEERGKTIADAEIACIKAIMEAE